MMLTLANMETQEDVIHECSRSLVPKHNSEDEKKIGRMAESYRTELCNVKSAKSKIEEKSVSTSEATNNLPSNSPEPNLKSLKKFYRRQSQTNIQQPKHFQSDEEANNNRHNNTYTQKTITKGRTPRKTKPTTTA